MGNTIELADWLNAEMARQGLTLSDVATRGNISVATISRVLSTERNPGPDTCTAIATALGYPPEFVFRKAGLLPEKTSPPSSQSVQEMTHLFDQLSDDDQHDILIMVRALVREKIRSYVHKNPPQTNPTEN